MTSQGFDRITRNPRRECPELDDEAIRQALEYAAANLEDKVVDVDGIVHPDGLRLNHGELCKDASPLYLSGL